MIGGLVGMAAADVAFVESAQAALVALLTGWRLPAGSRVACLPGEYAPNVAQLRTYGLRPEPLPVDGLGRAGRRGAGAAARAPTRRRFVHLTHDRQPPRAAPARRARSRRCAGRPGCRWSSTPRSRWATSDTDLGADVVYGTSRKWLAGPRGVGVLLRAAGAGRPADAGAARARGRAADAGVRVRRGAHRRPGRSGRGGRRAPRRRPRPRAGAAGGHRPGHPRAARRRRRAGRWSSRSTSRPPPRPCARRTASTSSAPAPGCSPSTAS